MTGVASSPARRSSWRPALAGLAAARLESVLPELPFERVQNSPSCGLALVGSSDIKRFAMVSEFKSFVGIRRGNAAKDPRRLPVIRVGVQSRPGRVGHRTFRQMPARGSGHGHGIIVCKHQVDPILAILSDRFETPKERIFDAQTVDIEKEDAKLRDAYGRHTACQRLLMARRLVEAGVSLVQVNWFRGPDEPSDAPCWDSHVGESERLRTVLAPPFDQAFSALLEELQQRVSAVECHLW